MAGGSGAKGHSAVTMASNISRTTRSSVSSRSTISQSRTAARRCDPGALTIGMTAA
jgi:hypothetical protein